MSEHADIIKNPDIDEITSGGVKNYDKRNIH